MGPPTGLGTPKGAQKGRGGGEGDGASEVGSSVRVVASGWSKSVRMTRTSSIVDEEEGEPGQEEGRGGGDRSIFIANAQYE